MAFVKIDSRSETFGSDLQNTLLLSKTHNNLLICSLRSILLPFKTTMILSHSTVTALLVAAAVSLTAADEDYCCLNSNGKEDPCNPEKWTCWPMARIRGFEACGRRGDFDCKFDFPDSVRDECCYERSDCFGGAGDSCYFDFATGRNIFGEDRYCTDDFFMSFGVPGIGFSGTICGANGFGGLDPHFQVR